MSPAGNPSSSTSNLRGEPSAKGPIASGTSPLATLHNLQNTASSSRNISNMTAAAAATSNSLLANLSEWRVERLKQLRPWKDFCDRDHFSRPEGLSVAQDRLAKNLNYFQSNYVVIFLLLTAYCLITNLTLLIAAVFIVFAGYFLSSRPSDQPIRLFGQEISVRQAWILYGVLAVLLLFVSSAGSALFWLVGAAALVIGLHASLHEAPVETAFTSV